MRYWIALVGLLFAPALPNSPTQAQMAPDPFGPVPHTCPGGPPFKTVPYFGQVVGHSPVWLRHFQRDKRGMLYLGDPLVWRHTRSGWTLKMEWTIEPGFTHPVTVWGGGLRDGRPIQGRVGPLRLPASRV